MFMKRLFVLFVSIGFCFAAFGSADTVSLGDILGDEAYGSFCPDGQTTWSLLPGQASFRAEIRLEDAGYRNTNRLGIYDLANPASKLELFAGAANTGASVEVNFDIAGGMAWIDPSHKVTMGSEFGFYLDSSMKSRGGVFYTQPGLNSGTDKGVVHALSFTTPDGGHWLAFEDLRVDTDWYDEDYNDMVVSFEGTGFSDVPEPSMVALLGLGVTVFLPRRR